MPFYMLTRLIIASVYQNIINHFCILYVLRFVFLKFRIFFNFHTQVQSIQFYTPRQLYLLICISNKNVTHTVQLIISQKIDGTILFNCV